MKNIIAQFQNVVAVEMNDEKRSELRAMFVESLKQFSGYTTHWEIEVSAVKNFLDNMREAFQEIVEKNIFTDIETLRIAALLVVDIYVSRERYDGRIAEFMASLGFLEDAWGLYEKAICHYPHNLLERGKDELVKQMRLLTEEYRRSGKNMPAFEDRMNHEARQIIEAANRAVIWDIFHPQKYIPWNQWYAQGQKHIPWDHVMDVAQKQLDKMGYVETAQQEMLKPAYADIIAALEKDRNNNAREGDTWWDKQIAKYTALL
jgi:hypothetical protein